jgi:hypothetical protein
MELLRACVAGLPRVTNACAILGSTPEYRQALRQEFAEVYIFDKHRGFKSLSDGIVGITDNEVFVEGDWNDVLASQLEKFDLVCSHFTHGNLRFENRKKFFAGVAGSLRRDGLFFDTIFDPQGRLHDLSEIETRFGAAPINLQTTNDFNAFAVFQSSILRQLKMVDTTAIYKWLAQVPSLHHIISYTKRLTPDGMTWFYDPGRSIESLGYWVHLEERLSVPEPQTSAFHGNVHVRVSKARQR